MLITKKKNKYKHCLDLFKRTKLASPSKGMEFYDRGKAHVIFHLLSYKLNLRDKFLQTKTQKEFDKLLENTLRDKDMNYRFQDCINKIYAIVDQTGYDYILEDDRELHMTKSQFDIYINVLQYINGLFDEWEIDRANNNSRSYKKIEYTVGNELKSLSFDTGLRSDTDESNTTTTEHKVPRIWSARHYFERKRQGRLSLEYIAVTFCGHFGRTAKVTPSENTTLMHYQREDNWDEFFGDGHWEENMADKHYYAYIANNILSMYDSDNDYEEIDLTDDISSDTMKKLHSFSNGKLKLNGSQSKSESSSSKGVVEKFKPKIEQFIQTECVHGNTYNTTTKKLHIKFNEQSSESIHINTFGRIISDLGYSRVTLDNGRGWKGLKLAS